MIINHNIASLNAWKNISNNDLKITKSIEKLSSGLRINSAGDDAAGLAISEKMRSQIKGTDMAKRNCMDVISILQTAEGALESVSDMLTRLKELTVQAGNGVYNTQDLGNMQLEINEIINQIDIVTNGTSFNGLTILDGTYENMDLNFQIGISPSEKITLRIPSSNADSLGVITTATTVRNVSLIDVTDIDLLEENLAVIDKAINDVSSIRATLGAVQNRAEYSMNNLTNASENMQSSESRIRDVDMAYEMANYTKLNVLIQSGMSVLAQSNQKTQHVLKLLQ